MLSSQNSILNLLLKYRIHSDFQGSLLCSHLVGSALFILFDCFIGVLKKENYEGDKIIYNH